MDALELLVEEHADLAERFRRLAWASNPAARREQVAELMRALDAHLTCEEHLLYASVAHRLGVSLTTEARRTACAVEAILHRLASLHPRDPAFAAVAAGLHQRFLELIETEDQELFPAVADRIAPAELAEIGALMEPRLDAARDDEPYEAGHTMAETLPSSWTA
jgi:hypothetical protein